MAGSAAEIKLLEYKDTITQLNTLLTAQTELNRSLQKTVKDLRQDNKNLMEQIDYLTKKLFGTSSEKSKDIEGQLCLFDEAEQAADPQETEESTAVTVPEHQRKARRTHEELFKGILPAMKFWNSRRQNSCARYAEAGWKPSGKNSYVMNSVLLRQKAR